MFFSFSFRLMLFNSRKSFYLIIILLIVLLCIYNMAARLTPFCTARSMSSWLRRTSRTMTSFLSFSSSFLWNRCSTSRPTTTASITSAAAIRMINVVVSISIIYYLTIYDLTVQRYSKKSVPTRVRTNGRTVSDKWSDKTTDCRTNTTRCRLYHSLPEDRLTPLFVYRQLASCRIWHGSYG